LLAKLNSMFCTGYCWAWVWDTYLGSKKTQTSHPRASRTYSLVLVMYSRITDLCCSYIPSLRTLQGSNFLSSSWWKY